MTFSIISHMHYNLNILLISATIVSFSFAKRMKRLYLMVYVSMAFSASCLVVIIIQSSKDAGTQVIQGPQGLPGIQGVPGPAGEKGDKGDKGDPADSPVFTKSFVSPDLLIGSANSATTLTHNMGVRPKMVQLYLVCITPQHGVSSGTVIPVDNLFEFGGNNFGASVQNLEDLNAVTIKVGRNGIRIFDPITGVWPTITLSNFRFRLNVFA